jgi:hypothetical protein
MLLANGYNKVMTPMEYQNTEMATIPRNEFPVAVVQQGRTGKGPLTQVAGGRSKSMTIGIATVLFVDTTEIEAASEAEVETFINLIDENEQLLEFTPNGVDLFDWEEDEMYFLKNVIARDTKPCGGNAFTTTVNFRVEKKC